MCPTGGDFCLNPDCPLTLIFLLLRHCQSVGSKPRKEMIISKHSSVEIVERKKKKNKTTHKGKCAIYFMQSGFESVKDQGRCKGGRSSWWNRGRLWVFSAELEAAGAGGAVQDGSRVQGAGVVNEPPSPHPRDVIA